MKLIARLTAGCALAAVLTTANTLPAAAQAQTPATHEARRAIEQIVRDYILANPEIIMEAVARLREKKQIAEEDADRQILAAVRDEIANDPNSYVGGNPAGDVTVVEFFDYRCGVCKQFHPIVAELVQSDTRIRRVYKEWPILGPDSVVASRAAIASRKQGKYLAFHVAMMESRAPLDEARILQIAASVGLDTGRLRKDMASSEVEQVIARNYALAEKLKLNGTPSFLIGDKILRGGRDLDSLRALVAEARAKK